MEDYNQASIQAAVNTRWAGKRVLFADEIDSTNLWARRLGREKAEHGTLCVAEFQSAGRGSRGRRWDAKQGDSVMMSLLLRPSFAPSFAPLLTLVMGLSTAYALKKILGDEPDVSLKWPNDVVIAHKKVCGILTEMELEGEAIRDVVIGVGLNVHTAAFPEELSDKATSLYLETGKEFNRAEIIGRIMQIFEKNYECFVRTCDLTFLKDSYEAILINKGKRVTVLDAAAPYEGTALGIDPEGCLLVKTDDGAVKAIRAGEVSVRGLYSYV